MVLPFEMVSCWNGSL